MTARTAIALAAVTALAASLGVAAVDTTDAAWTQRSTHSAMLATVTVPQVGSFSCGAASGLIANAIPVSWTAPRLATGLAEPTSYTVTWSGLAGTGSKSVTGLSTTLPARDFVGGESPTTLGVIPQFAGWGSLETAPTLIVRALLSSQNAVIGWTCRTS
ncbi:MAG: hypothetical protein H7146_10710 [Burkholderiaceae bacterium]|nr:hypothetical protein [Microbacteriaceae bacterium]